MPRRATQAAGSPVWDGSDPNGVPAVSAGQRHQLERIQHDFEELGLNGNQARILAALLRLRPTTGAQLARITGIHRTSAFPVLGELRTRGLAEQIPGESGLWTSPGADEVVDRLVAAHEERLHELRARSEETRRVLAELAPVEHGAATYVHLLGDVASVRAAYDRLLREARQEFVVLNRPPYSAAAERTRRGRAAADSVHRDEVNPAVSAAIGRGVAVRALYERAPWEDPAAASFRFAMGHYHAAGVEGRLVESLPIKLAMADRRLALLALTDPLLPDIGFPANLLVEHPGFCDFQAKAFEHLWATAQPCPAPASNEAAAHGA